MSFEVNIFSYILWNWRVLCKPIMSFCQFSISLHFRKQDFLQRVFAKCYAWSYPFSLQEYHIIVPINPLRYMEPKKNGTAKIQSDCSKWLFKVNYLSITFKVKYILRIMNLRDFFLSINRASFLRCYLVVFFNEIISYWFLSMQKARRLRPIFIGKWSW